MWHQKDIEIVAKDEVGNEQVIPNFTKENSKVDGKNSVELLNVL